MIRGRRQQRFGGMRQVEIPAQVHQQQSFAAPGREAEDKGLLHQDGPVDFR